MSVAYLITSHRLPRQVLRLAAVLRRGSAGAAIVVHHDGRVPSLERAALDRLDVRLVEPAHRVAWGHFSHVDAVLRSLSWLLNRLELDWVVLISGQDYPIQPIAEIERRLAFADVDAFIEAVPCDAPQGGLIDEFTLRYHFRWYRIPRWLTGEPMRAVAARSHVRIRVLPRSGAWLGIRSGRTPFKGEFMCYRGADWFSLSRKAVELVLEQCGERAALMRYYRRTLIPSESVVQTILGNQQALRISGDVRRYTQWEQPHKTGPRVLGLDDLEAVLRAPADFARKFDEEVDTRVLDEIDRRVHGIFAGEADVDPH